MDLFEAYARRPLESVERCTDEARSVAGAGAHIATSISAVIESRPFEYDILWMACKLQPWREPGRGVVNVARLMLLKTSVLVLFLSPRRPTQNTRPDDASVERSPALPVNIDIILAHVFWCSLYCCCTIGVSMSGISTSTWSGICRWMDLGWIG